jgi:hypothetical protein
MDDAVILWCKRTVIVADALVEVDFGVVVPVTISILETSPKHMAVLNADVLGGVVEGHFERTSCYFEIREKLRESRRNAGLSKVSEGWRELGQQQGDGKLYITQFTLLPITEQDSCSKRGPSHSPPLDPHLRGHSRGGETGADCPVPPGTIAP